MGTILNSACKSTGIFCGNLKKLFAVLQANLRPNGYTLKESAYDRVSNLLNTKTRIFVNKIKAEDNGKRQRKKAGKWMKLSINPQEIYQSPYDIFAKMNVLKQEIALSDFRNYTELQNTASLS